MKDTREERLIQILLKLTILLSLIMLVFSVIPYTVNASFSNAPDYTCPYCLETIEYYYVTCGGCSPPQPDLRTDCYRCFDCDQSSHISCDADYCTNYYLCN